jgi:putative aldouronate transport system permease protein
MKLRQGMRLAVKHRGLYLFVLPALVSVFLFNYRPMAGVVMAFQDFDMGKGYVGSPLVGFKHFARFLANPDFYAALKNTVGLSLLSFVFGFPIPIVFALVLNEVRSKGVKRVSQTISYLPHFISWIIVATMVLKMLDQESGIVNDLLAALGGQRIAFMRESKYFWPILLVTTIWKETGWNSIIYLAALTAIDQEIYEAAMVDGAGRMRRLVHITLPSLAPTIALLLVLNVGSLFNAGGHFDAVYNLQNPLVADAANIVEVYAFYEGIVYSRFSYAAAITLTQSLFTLLLVLGTNRVYRRLSGYSVF